MIRAGEFGTRGRRATTAALVVVGGAIGWASPAAAATDAIVVEPPAPPETTNFTFSGGSGPGGVFLVDAGTQPNFTNRDEGDSHNVVATDEGPDDESLFQTPLLSAGSTAPVVGTQYLSPGTYRFVCTIHVGMEGSLSVAGPGAVPRPEIEVMIASTRLAKVAKGKLAVVVGASTPSEDVEITARLGSKRLAGAAGIDLAAGETRTLTLRLDRRARKLLAGLERAKVSLSAEVPFGAPDSAKRTLK